MTKILTGVFFLGLLSLLVGYGLPAVRHGHLLLAAGWFAVLWPGLALMVVLPVKVLEKVSWALPAGPDPDRRRILSHAASWIATAAAGPLTLRGIAAAGKLPDIRRVTVPVAGGHPDLNGFRLVQISDLHLDRWTDPKRVEHLTASVNRLRPHLIAVTGDLADDRVAVLRNTVAPLTGLSAPFGSYFVTGNHEYRSAAGGVTSWLDEIRRLGFIVLHNDHRVVAVKSARLAVAGVCDFDAAQWHSTHVSRPADAARGTGRTDYRVLLAHQPRSMFEAAEAGFDLQLSGHTHGGQCFPGHLMVRLTQPFLSGLHRYHRLDVYVSAGVGTCGAPIRLGAPAEISLLVLRIQEPAGTCQR
jgi:predicted MPP superfamily phosphohydrolase